MRTILLLALGGIAVGLVVALLIAWTRPAQTVTTCTREGLGLAPTLAVPASGDTIDVGLVTTGTGCAVSSRASRTVRIRVEGKDGRVLVDSARPGGPAPGVELGTRLTDSIAAAGAKLCAAAQPLRIDVWVAGAHARGDQRMQLVGGRCAVAS